MSPDLGSRNQKVKYRCQFHPWISQLLEFQHQVVSYISFKGNGNNNPWEITATLGSKIAKASPAPHQCHDHSRREKSHHVSPSITLGSGGSICDFRFCNFICVGSQACPGVSQAVWSSRSFWRPVPLRNCNGSVNESVILWLENSIADALKVKPWEICKRGFCNLRLGA